MLPLLLAAAAAVAPSTSSYKSVMQWAQKYTQKSLMSRLRLGCCYAMSQMKISRFSSLLFVLFPSSSYCLPKIHLSLGKNVERGGTPAWSRKVIFLTLEGESLGNVFPHSTPYWPLLQRRQEKCSQIFSDLFFLLRMIKVLSRPNYVSRVFYVVLLTSFEDCQQTMAAAAVGLPDEAKDFRLEGPLWMGQ